MQLYTSMLLSAIAAISGLSTFTQAQTSGSITCDNGGPNNIVTADIQGLISALDSGFISGVNNPIALADGAQDIFGGVDHQNIVDGSLLVVLKNENVFQATHVSFSTLSQALQQVSEVCCGSFPDCIKGQATVIGDDGAGVTLFVNNVNDDPLRI